jgi:hypothetical protein
MFRRAALVLVMAACGGGPSDTPVDATADDAAIDAFTPIHVDDGTPQRRPCTNSYGTALTKTFGRLDGILVAIVPPGGSSCNADNDHLHLQVEANGATYDVAVNINGSPDDVRTTTRDLPLPGPVWDEGWHTGLPISYPSMGVHAGDLTTRTSAQLVSDLMADLSTVNHISIFAIGYGPEGAHNVHRNDFNHDGLVITEPLSTPAHARLFSFSTQTF